MSCLTSDLDSFGIVGESRKTIYFLKTTKVELSREAKVARSSHIMNSHSKLKCDFSHHRPVVGKVPSN
jgi:hypothetical protein